MVKSKKRKKSKLDKNHYGLLFVLPFFIVFLIFGLFPIIRTFSLAFFKYDMGINSGQFVGLLYIKRALGDIFVWKGIYVGIKLWVLQYIFELGTALVIGAVFTYIKLKGEQSFKSIFYVPNLVSTAAIATLFSLFMGFPEGMFNQLLLKLNLIDSPIMFLNSGLFIQIVVIFIGWWMWFGRTTIVASAGMTSISNDYYEAAKMDGANFKDIFRHITIPLMKPILLFMIITSFIGGLQSFDLPFMLTSSTAGGPNGVVQTISMYIYRHGFEIGNIGYAAAISIILFVVIIIFSVVAFSLAKEKEQK